MRTDRTPSRLTILRAAAAAAVATLATACTGEALDVGPTQAQVVAGPPVYDRDPSVSTRGGAAVPMSDAPVTEDADRIVASTTRPAPDGDDRVTIIGGMPPATLPTTEPTADAYTSDGMTPTYADPPPVYAPQAYESTPSYDYGGPYAGANYNAAAPYASPYDREPEDYWIDRGFWSGSPYFYDNYVRYGYGYSYPYSRVDGRRIYFRDYDRGSRNDPRAFERNWNDRARDRYREDRTPRVPPPVTDRDRDGNGIDDRYDDGRQRPVRDARQAIPQRPPTVAEQLDDRRRAEADRQAEFIRQQQRDASGRPQPERGDAEARRQAGIDANNDGRASDAAREAEARRQANRDAAEARRDAAQQRSQRDDAPRSAPPPPPTPNRHDDASAREAPRREEPARRAEPARREEPVRREEPARREAPAPRAEPPRDDAPRRSAEPAPARVERAPAADRPVRDAGSAQNAREGGARNR